MKKRVVIALSLMMQIGFSQDINTESKDKVDVFIEDAVMYDIDGDFENSIINYERALNLEKSAIIYAGLAKVYHQMDQNVLAMENYNKSIALDRSNTEALINRANLNVDLGNNIAAINDYTEALIIDPNDMYAYMQRAFCFSEIGFQGEALRDFAIAIQINAEEAKAYYNMAEVSGIISEENKVVNTLPEFLADNNTHAALVQSVFL
jgi:tetratricopeptide (TPR) repeat protein